MRLIHAIPAVGKEAAGPSYSVPRLARALAARGHEVDLIEVGDPPFQRRKEMRHSRYAQDFASVPILKSLHFSRGYYKAACEMLHSADLIHNHSIWLMPNVYPAWAAKREGKPLIVSPRGTFSPAALAISPLKKKIFWALAQGPAVRAARVLHATSEQEYADIRAYGLKQPVFIVPNGIDVPAARPHLKCGNRRRLLFLGRVHPIKGLENLIAAWARIGPRFPEWDLRLVGPGPDDYVASLQKLAADLAAPNVAFAGAVYGDAKNDEYAAADLYVLPSFSENFGMSVAEALANATPSIVTHGMPWRGVEPRDCGWWVSADEAGMADALERTLPLERARLAQMGENGRAWMLESFGWDRIADEMEAVYRWVSRGGEAPATVRMD